MIEPRHSRQARLAEIGEAGQARLAATRATVAGEGLAAQLAARYLAGAGVETLACASAAVEAAARAVDARVRVAVAFPAGDEPCPDFGIRDASAAEVARGAWRALDVLRKAVRPA